MNTAVEVRQDARPTAQTMDDVIARGDLSKLTHEQRVEHYYAVCKSAGLNPLTQPLQYMTLQGKLILYCNADGADQLRRIHGINIEIPTHKVNDAGLLMVHARAVDKNGRSDEDYGVVSVVGLKGEAAANAFMKAVTKAKRRVTLSISGLGLPDEMDLPILPVDAPADKPLPQMKAKPAPVDPPAPAEPPGRDQAQWTKWCTEFLADVDAQQTVDAVNELTNRNADELAKLKAFNLPYHDRLIVRITEHIAHLTEEGT